MSLAPIALFVYNRPIHTRMTLDALMRNTLAHQSTLYVFSDGVRISQHEKSVVEVRNIIKRLKGFRQIEIVNRDYNYGLATSVIDGVSRVIREHGKVIVVEDDLVTSPYFLKFMNDGLTIYENHEKVASIHGYVYPVKEPLPELFFLKGADCWGWATWERAWHHFEPNGQKLLDTILQMGLQFEFNFDGYFDYLQMLKDQIKRKNDSWAIRWHASAFIEGRYTLYPGRSLVNNIGHDWSGSHSVQTRHFDTNVADTMINVTFIPIEENAIAKAAFKKYFRETRRNILSKMVSVIKKKLR